MARLVIDSQKYAPAEEFTLLKNDPHGLPSNYFEAFVINNFSRFSDNSAAPRSWPETFRSEVDFIYYSRSRHFATKRQVYNVPNAR